MKRSLLLAFSVCTLFTLCAQDADTLGFSGFKQVRFAQKQNLIKASAVPFFMGQIPYCGEFRITYERMLTHNQSLSVGFSYNYPNPIFLLSALLDTGQTLFKAYSFRGARGTFGYRFYPFKEMDAPDGIYFGPYVSYNFVRIKERNGNGSYLDLNYFNAGGIIGYQIKADDNLYFDIFTGIGYRKNFWVEFDARTNRRKVYDTQPLIPALQHVKFYLQINAAYAF